MPDGARRGQRRRRALRRPRAGRAACRRRPGRATPTFDAEGCGAAPRGRRAPACALVAAAGARGCTRRRRRRSTPSSAACRPGKLHAADLAADALHRALSRAWCRRGEPLAAPRARQRAGRPQRRGGQRGRGAARAPGGPRGRGRHAEALGRPGGRRRAQLLLAAGGARARALAHSMGLPHLTLDLEDRFRAAVVDRLRRRARRGPHAEPVRALQRSVRFDAMLALAERLGADALVTGHYARVEHDGEGPLLARAADADKDQTYMLSALRPELLARIRFPLGELTKPQVREIAARRGPAGRRQAREPGPLLPRRHEPRALPRPARRRAATRPARSWTARGRVLGTPSAATAASRSASAAGSGSPPGEPLYVLATDAARTAWSSARASELAAARVTSSRRRSTATAAALTASSFATAPSRCRCRVGAARRRAHETLDGRLDERVYGVAAGQTACLLEGERVLGHGTIALRRALNFARDGRPAPRPRSGKRSSPSSRSATTARALGVARAVGLRPVGAADDGRHAAVQALLPGPGGAAAPAADLVPEVLPHDRHRPGRPRPPATSPSSRCWATSRSATTSSRTPSGSPGSCRREGFGIDPERIWITVFEGDDGARPGARRGGDRVLARRRRAGRADRAAAALGELLAGGPGRPCGPARSSTTTAAPSSAAPTTARATTPTASSSSGTSSSCSTCCTRTARSSRCRSATSTPGRPRPAGGDPAGRALGLRERPVPAAGRAGRGAVRAPLRRRTGDDHARCV